MALQAYRALLRSAHIAFAGDTAVLTAALSSVRENFELNRPVTDSAEKTKLIRQAEEIAKFLRESVVQGVPKGEDKYELQIHEFTERGDNESIKMGGKGTVGGGGCCGGK